MQSYKRFTHLDDYDDIRLLESRATWTTASGLGQQGWFIAGVTATAWLITFVRLATRIGEIFQ